MKDRKNKPKKQRKPVSKGLIRAGKIALSIFIIIKIIVDLSILSPLIVETGYFLCVENGMETGIVDTKLTTEQKQKDFDYMYNIVCLENPRKELFEEAYGINYEDIYNKYHDLVVNSSSEFEFFSYMSCFLAVLPGEHNFMNLPDGDFSDVNGFKLWQQLGREEVQAYEHSYIEDFRDDVEAYKDCSLFAFNYMCGKYLFMNIQDDTRKCVSGYAGAELISIDGKDPCDACFDLFERTVPNYDGVNDRFFRRYILFNDTVGETHTLEILMPDGTTQFVDVHKDPCFDVAYFDGPGIYNVPEVEPSTGDETEDVPVHIPDVMDDDYVPTTYTIVPDPERHLVYLESTSCEKSEGDRLVRDLNKAIEEADADSIILDARNNGGGDISFVTDQLLPSLFTHDVEFKADAIGGRNEWTRRYCLNVFERLVNIINHEGFPTFDSEYYYTVEDFSVKGHAEHDCRIYLLTSQRTFSSGDIMTNLCKAYDNCVVVGSNTGGEGICGPVYNCYLPESRFSFTYVPAVNIDVPENNYLGTEPDIYADYSIEAYRYRLELSDEGVATSTYEGRQLWDTTLLTVLDMIERGE